MLGALRPSQEALRTSQSSGSPLMGQDPAVQDMYAVVQDQLRQLKDEACMWLDKRTEVAMRKARSGVVRTTRDGDAQKGG